MKLFSRSSATCAAVMALLICGALAANPAFANTYTGTVKNGTTNKPGAGVDVILLSLEGDMQTVANTKTDAQGHFSLSYTPTGQMPLLVRAIYQGVNYHAALPPGKTSADVQIYEATANSSTVTFPSHLVAFQPSGNVLEVGEEYVVQNQSKPPVTYFKTDGNFDFQIPAGAANVQVSAQGPEHMPISLGTISRGKDRYSVAYAFRPDESGESAVRVSYEIPYATNQATVHLAPLYSSQNVALLAPPTMTLGASGFQPAGNEEGMTVYSRDNVAAGTGIDVAVSGTAPPPTDGGQQGQTDAGAAGGTGHEDGAPVAAVAPRLDSLKWVLLGGFGALFILGAAFLMRRQLPAAAVAAVPQAPVRTRHASQTAPVTAPVAPAAATEMRAVDREIGMSLDELKDRLFKLELRHQAGTISDAEYAEQRAKTEKILRDLVRG
jgi:hypothetical protein